MARLRTITKEQFMRIIRSTSSAKPKTLTEVIDKAERDFTNGLGRTFTVEELRDLMHENA